MLFWTHIGGSREAGNGWREGAMARLKLSSSSKRNGFPCFVKKVRLLSSQQSSQPFCMEKKWKQDETHAASFARLKLSPPSYHLVGRNETKRADSKANDSLLSTGRAITQRYNKADKPFLRFVTHDPLEVQCFMLGYMKSGTQKSF